MRKRCAPETVPLRALRTLVDARLLPAANVPGDVMRSAIVVAHFARATSTVDGIVALSELGLGSQVMLNRALYELMINAWWSRLDVDGAERLIVGYAQLDWQLCREKARSYPWLLGDLHELDELSGEQSARLVNVHGAFGQKGWTGKSRFGSGSRILRPPAAGRGCGIPMRSTTSSRI